MGRLCHLNKEDELGGEHMAGSQPRSTCKGAKKVPRDWERRERKRERGNEIEAAMVANEADE